MSVINFAEVQYIIARRRKMPPQVIAAAEALPIAIASADAYIKQVVRIKAQHSISLTDCFAAALAIDLNCPLVTSDPEFRKLEGMLTVDWLS